MTEKRNTQAHFTGCLLGGAAGDALGAPVEFLSLAQIRRKYGEAGIRDFDLAYGRVGAITDDTQMTLFTAEGLILHRTRRMEIPVTEAVYQAYLRWLSTQWPEASSELTRRHGACAVADGILMGHKALHDQRAPGRSCIGALAGGRMGAMQQPVNDSKGCGGVMRIAPVGLLFSPAEAFRMGCEVAAITHGHPTGYLAAGAMARLIAALREGASLADGVADMMTALSRHPDHGECLAALRSAMDLWRSAPPCAETVARLGGGWIAEEALAIGVYCALAAEGDFEKGLVLAVNHGGDSDSTGAIAGNIMGLMLGEAAIPTKFLDPLELRDLISEIAADLFGMRRVGMRRVGMSRED